MSWDVVVFDFQGSPPPIDEWEGDAGSPLGSPEEVRRKIDAQLPGVAWSDPGNGIYDADEFSFEFRLLEEESVENFLIAVRGSGDAVAALLQLATPNRWSLLDGSTSEWIDPANPLSAGWERFQEFRDQAVATMTAENENGPEESEISEESASGESPAERTVPAESVAELSERPRQRKAAARKKKKASKKKAAANKTAGAKKAAKGKKKGAAKRTAPKKKAAGKKKGAAQKKATRKKKAAAKKAGPKKKKAAAKGAKKTAKNRVVKKKSANKKRK